MEVKGAATLAAPDLVDGECVKCRVCTRRGMDERARGKKI